MMAQEYGPAQPIYDAAKSVYKKVSGLVGGKADAPVTKVVDDNYHKEMVEKANESFRKVSAPSNPTPAKSPARKVSTSRKYINTKR